MGKITVIKKLRTSQTYICPYVLTQPFKTNSKRIENSKYEFIWEGKPEKIKRDILTKKYENGSLKMTDLETLIESLKLTWIKRFM